MLHVHIVYIINFKNGKIFDVINYSFIFLITVMNKNSFN